MKDEVTGNLRSVSSGFVSGRLLRAVGFREDTGGRDKEGWVRENPDGDGKFLLSWYLGL